MSKRSTGHKRRELRAREAAKEREAARRRKEARQAAAGPRRPPRVRRRRLLLWLSIVPAMLVFGYGVHLAALNSNFEAAMAHYEAEEWWDSYRGFSEMRSPNLADPWKAHFNTGTAAYRNDMFYVAESRLIEALESVPDEHRCDVLTNLSIVLEANGRDYQERADEELAWAEAQFDAEVARLLGEPYDESLFELDYDDTEITSIERFELASWYQRSAADNFARAAAAINDPACQTPPEPDASEAEQEQAEQEQEQRESEQERLEDEAIEADRQRQEIDQKATGEEAEPDPEPTPEGETEEERAAREEAERQEQLEQRNEDAEEEAEGGGDGDGDGEGEDGEGSSGSPPISNW